MELNEFFENLSNGAKWDVGVGINRTNKLPLDASSVFSSKTAAENYAKGIVAEGQTANAYPGMILSVVEEAETVIYYIDANMELQPVGNTKDVMAYIGEIPETADADTIIEYINKKTEGIATDAALEQLQASVNGILTTLVGDPDDDTDGLVGAVAANTQAIADEKAAREAAIGKAAEGETAATGVYLAIANALQAAKDYADAQDADTIYDDTAVTGRLDVIERDYLQKKDKYDDTEVRGLISDLDEAIGDTNGGLVKDIADNKAAIEAEVSRATAKEAELAQAIAAIDFIDQDELDAALAPINTELAKKATQSDLEALEGRVDAFLTGTGATDALDSLQELITYIKEHDDVELADIIADIEALQAKVDTGDQKVSEYVTAAIDALKIGDYAKASDLTTLAGRVKALEDADNATQAELDAYKSEVETAIATAKSEAISDADGKLANKVNTSDFNTFKTENTQAISSAVEAAKTEVTTAVAGTYATKAELEAVNTLATNAATKTYVDTELAKKANADIVYTKSEIDLKIGTPGTPAVKDEEGTVTTPAVQGTGVFANTYSKEELNALLDEIEGGSTESAASVARQLDAYKSSNDDRVAKIEAKDLTQDEAITAAQTTANSGVSKADAAQAKADANAIAIDTLTNVTVKGNTDSIAALQTRVAATEKSTAENAGAISELTGTVNGIDTTVKDHVTVVSGIQARLVSLENEDIRLDTAIKANATEIAKKANSADVYTKSEVDTELGKKANSADVYTKGQVDTLIANLDQTELENGIAANAADIAVLVGADKDADGRATKSVREIAKEEVALVVGTAPDALDTLEEVANWIANDQSGAAAMANDIAANKAILAGFGTGEGQTATVQAAIESAKQEAIAAIPALEVATAEKLGGVKSVVAILDEEGKITNAAAIENKVAVAADGSMEVNSLNVNKLTQTSGDVLILDGGSAEV